MARILLLMPSSTYHAPDFMAAAARLGVEVIVGTDRRQALEEATRDAVLALDFLRPEESARRVVELQARLPVDAVVGTDDDTVVIAAVIARALGLPANPPEAVRAARSKQSLRARLAEAGLPTPAFHVHAVGDDPETAATRAAYPCVLKPTFLAASRGVIRADDPSAFAAAFRRLRAILADPEVTARGGPEAGHILVESYVAGPEVALEALLGRGELHPLALFDKPDPLEGPYFAETLYVTPSRLPATDRDRVTRAVAQAAAALGLRDGPIHAEVRLGGDEPLVIDLAARTIGGLCSRTLRFGTGLSLEEVILRHALGRDLEPPERESGAAGVLMLPIERGGVLREVRGQEEARRVPHVVEIDITVPPGGALVPLPEGDRYLGFVFARAATPEQVEAALRAAWQRVEILVD